MEDRTILVEIIKEAAKLKSGVDNLENLQDSVSGFNLISDFDYDNNGEPDKFITYDGTGFAAIAYRNPSTNEVVIAYRGTNSTELVDWTKNNLNIGMGEVPVQYTEASHFYNLVAEKYGKDNITVIGHSLGGALAQLIGAEYNVNTITFNAPGVLHLLKNINPNLSLNKSDYTNITNYNLANDVLNILNVAFGYEQLGNSFIIPADNKNPMDAHLDYDALKSSNYIGLEQWKNLNKDYCNMLSKANVLGDILPMIIRSGGLITRQIVKGYVYRYFVPITMKELFTSAQSAEVPRDPLLIDLDGDGIETTSVENGVYFDQENDGFAEVSAWVSSDDGVLAIDKNNNGTIDNGSELFGDSYVKSDGTIATSGFDALSDLDSNGDGQINSSDTSFDAIKILKGDGTLLSLSDAGISSISLTAKKSVIRDSNGNRQLTSGTYTKTDGSTGMISDYELQSDPMNSIATDWLEVSAEIAALPDIPGMGKMYSLHQAMARDEELTALIKSFVNAPDASTRQSLIPQIIYKWADVENIASDSRGSQMDAKDLTALEKFMGSEFLGVTNSGIPNSTAANLLENAYAILKSYIYAELTAQTALKPIYEMLELEYDEALQKYVYNLDTVQNYIDSVISQDTMSGKELLLDFAGTFINLGLKETSNYSSFEQHYIEMGDDFKLLMQTVDKINIYGTEGDDNIEGTAQQEAVFGYGGNDTIYTRQGDDLVYGGDGNDIIDTCEANDVIYGEAGDDTINSGDGVDIVYGGDGNDTITNSGGDDYIDGGAGDDIIKSTSDFHHPTNETLIGGKGNDYFEDKDAGDETFIFNVGDGNDIIKNNGGSDTIRFDASVSKNNIVFYKDQYSSNLFVDYGIEAGNDIIKITDQRNQSCIIENFEVKDDSGTTYFLSNEDVNRIIQDMSAYAVENGMSITSAADIRENADLMNLVNSAWQTAA